MDTAITGPDQLGQTSPADGQEPSGRLFVPADRAMYGAGVAQVLDQVAGLMPRSEVEAAWAFPGVKRDGKEHGVVVISRRAAGDRHVIYRARYVIQEKGQERGAVAATVEETAEGPPDMLPRVIAGVRDRADEAGDADPVDLGPWKSDDDQHRAE